VLSQAPELLEGRGEAGEKGGGVCEQARELIASATR
jgi:hypothetical protein